MLNCLFYSMFFLLFLNVSFGSLRMSQINRAFMSIYKGDFEASVITVDKNGEPTIPYYSQPTLRKYVADHLENQVRRYTTNYVLDLTFYKDTSNTPCSETEIARKVKLSLKANVNYLFKYEKEKNFLIKSRN